MDIIYFSSANKDNFFLSNFYPFTFTYDGKEWPSSEHLYQALKYECETKEEHEWRELIRNASTPFISKYLGHQFNYVKHGWEIKYRNTVLLYKDKVRYAGDIHSKDFRLHIMYLTCKAKFSNEEMKKKLLATGNKRLAEVAKDSWGGLPVYNEDGTIKSGWLGGILEIVRQEMYL